MIITKKALPRRTFLKGIGATLSLPLLDAMVPAATALEKTPAKSNRLVVTTFDKGNHALSGTRWRYIRYKDGNEELYDQKNDPHEWINLASNVKNAPVRKRFAKALDEILTKGK